MKVSIIGRKEKQYGSMSRYYNALVKYISSSYLFHVDNSTSPFIPKCLTEYIRLFQLRRDIEKDGIIHFTEPYFGHFLYFMNTKNTVITCHDIYHTVVNDFKGSNKIFYNLSMKGMLKAKKIITDSENTKRDLMNYLKCPEEKIKVIPLGVDLEKYRKCPVTVNKDENVKYIVHVGAEGYKGRKNVYGLIRAFYKLKKRMPEVKMIQAGVAKRVYAKLVEEFGLQHDIQFVGIASEDKVIKLYNNADVFVFPSYYEGFGLPPLEAMACGCPVITSNTSSLPEVIGDAGIMVDPNDIDGLSNAMYEVLINDGLRQDMIKKGLKRAKLFSWVRTAKETYDIYKEIYNEI